MRKIAANYILLPGFPLIKNGYAILKEEGVEAVDTEGVIREMAGMEFYGGLLVPAYIREYENSFSCGDKMLPLLKQYFAERGNNFRQLAIIEGADLLHFTRRSHARVRLL